jgi:membrane fusion protein (multidrug efflux system)
MQPMARRSAVNTIDSGRSHGRRALLRRILAPLLILPAVTAGCSGGDGRGERPGGGPHAAGASRGGMPWGGGMPQSAAAIPVEVATAERRDMSAYIETNGTLEAENEVDIVARTSGPIVELLVEEGMSVRKDQLLARLEQDEIRAQLEISRVDLNETRLAYERAQQLQQNDLISAEEYEQALAAYDSARAQYEGNTILLGYTEIKAPFTGLIVARYVDFAQQLSVNTPLFRISDFTPLLCPIQVPERDLAKLRSGQPAYLTVEPFPGERFEAAVLRISPVVDAATGTIKVTLEVDARGKLRPGMFARVFLETATREDTLVIPKTALSLESIGDTIYVATGEGTASRREVRLGFQQGDFVEVLAGLSENEAVVIVGQDGLSDGTPIQILRQDGASVQREARTASAGQEAEGTPPGVGGGGRPGGPPDFSTMTPERLEQIKERMRARGMSEEQIEERIRRFREGAPAGKGGGPRGSDGGSDDSAAGARPPDAR